MTVLATEFGSYAAKLVEIEQCGVTVAMLSSLASPRTVFCRSAARTARHYAR